MANNNPNAAVRTIDDIHVLKHILIKDTGRYARDMSISKGAAQYCSSLVTHMVYDIQENMANCQTNMLVPLNPFTFLFRFGYRISQEVNVDAYLVRVTEDLFRRIKMALYNEPSPDFNDISLLGRSSVPWAIVDINQYACKWGIDIVMATDICNWLIGVYESVKLITPTVAPTPVQLFELATGSLSVALKDFGGMSALNMTRLAEDVYMRFRYIVLQRCGLTTNSMNNLDYQAQLLMFYDEQRKVHNLSNQCLQG